MYPRAPSGPPGCEDGREVIRITGGFKVQLRGKASLKDLRGLESESYRGLQDENLRI